MDDSAIIEKLLLFGLGRQEAILYLCLLRNGSMTGYEAAKQTGISRSNVYNALAALAEHGAAYVAEGAASRYTAVSLEEFCDNRIRYLGGVRDYLIQNGPRPSRIQEGYLTVEGRQHILDKIHHMLLSADRRVYFSAEAEFLELWREELQELADRRIKIVLISGRAPENLPPDGIIFYKSLPMEEERGEQAGQLRLIIDSAYVLTGELTGGENDACLYSAQKNFVNVFKEAMHNEIRLIELEKGQDRIK